MMRTPNYEIVEDQAGKPLVVRDLGPWEHFPTITNAPEALVDELQALGKLPWPRVLFYYDSEGQMDQLVLEWNPALTRCRFLRFAPGPRPRGASNHG